MNSKLTNSYKVGSSRLMQEVGKIIGSRLKGHEFIELISDLGAGKTTLVRGMVEGSGSHDHVSSPSFTIRNEYHANGFTIVHFDMYRLTDPGIIRMMIEEDINNSKAVVIVEWGTLLEEVFPEQRLSISFKVNGINDRQLTITRPDNLNYLVEGLNEYLIN